MFKCRISDFGFDQLFENLVKRHLNDSGVGLQITNRRNMLIWSFQTNEHRTYMTSCLIIRICVSVRFLSSYIYMKK